MENKEKKIIKRQFIGTVVSVKEDKTVHVLVESKKMHPKYRKQYRVTKKFAVHDEKNQAKKGDKVLFQECRPISKTKRCRLIKIEKAN